MLEITSTPTVPKELFNGIDRHPSVMLLLKAQFVRQRSLPTESLEKLWIETNLKEKFAKPEVGNEIFKHKLFFIYSTIHPFLKGYRINGKELAKVISEIVITYFNPLCEHGAIQIIEKICEKEEIGSIIIPSLLHLKSQIDCMKKLGEPKSEFLDIDLDLDFFSNEL